MKLFLSNSYQNVKGEFNGRSGFPISDKKPMGTVPQQTF
jgi:hypothetical protein